MKKIFNHEMYSLKNTNFIQEIIKRGWSPYLVGGYVRDYIMNKKSKDIDIIIIGCEKTELIELLSKYGKPDLVGESFAVIKYHHNGEIYDISTPRTEKKIGDGHKGFEIISNKNISLEQDLFRRDLTINSIAMNFDGKFIDPFDGREDIKNKIIKITNPDAFTDDPLRILRVCRFASRLGFIIDKNTSILMTKIKPFISQLSQERIHEEWNKVIEHAEYGGVEIMERYIELLTEYDMWEQMFPGLEITTNNIIIDYLENAIIFYDLFNKVDFNKRRKYLVETLKFKGDLVNELHFLQEYHDSDLIPETIYKLAKLRKRFDISEGLIRDFVNHDGNKARQKKFMLAFFRYCDAGFIINGDDLIEQGFKGAEIEKEKERLEIERFKNEYMSK
jgi:tRNA nucleotidyltransferase/poly(A) polymerase